MNSIRNHLVSIWQINGTSKKITTLPMVIIREKLGETALN